MGIFHGSMLDNSSSNRKLVVYPSHYEGCGLPVLDALALRKPVIVLNTEVNRELLKLTSDPNLHLINSTSELSSCVRQVLPQALPRSPSSVPGWRAVGLQYSQALRQMLSQEIDYTKLRARWDLRRNVNALSRR